MRLVNHPESGTSSMLLTFRACVFDGGRPGVTKRLYDRSYISPMSPGLALDASCVSGSRASGSSPDTRDPGAAASTAAHAPAAARRSAAVRTWRGVGNVDSMGYLR